MIKSIKLTDLLNNDYENIINVETTNISYNKPITLQDLLSNEDNITQEDGMNTLNNIAIVSGAFIAVILLYRFIKDKILRNKLKNQKDIIDKNKLSKNELNEFKASSNYRNIKVSMTSIFDKIYDLKDILIEKVNKINKNDKSIDTKIIDQSTLMDEFNKSTSFFYNKSSKKIIIYSLFHPLVLSWKEVMNDNYIITDKKSYSFMNSIASELDSIYKSKLSPYIVGDIYHISKFSTFIDVIKYAKSLNLKESENSINMIIGNDWNSKGFRIVLESIVIIPYEFKENI